MNPLSRPLSRDFLVILHQRIRPILSVLIKSYRPRKIILFGSWVKGDFSEESDIDLLIIKSSPKNRLERAWEVYHLLSPQKAYPMDVIVLTPQELQERLVFEDPFIHEVLKNGIVLYEENC